MIENNNNNNHLVRKLTESKILTLANVTLPVFSFSWMIDSMRGVNILHGLHQLEYNCNENKLLWNVLYKLFGTTTKVMMHGVRANTHVAKKSTTTGVLLFLTLATKSSWLWILYICVAGTVVDNRCTDVRIVAVAETNLLPIALNILSALFVFLSQTIFSKFSHVNSFCLSRNGPLTKEQRIFYVFLIMQLWNLISRK